MEKIKLGIIGLGMAFDRLHYPPLMELKNKFQIVGISDKDEKKLELALKKLNLNLEMGFLDYRRLLETNIDAVLTLVPISENFEIAKDVLLAKKHLIGEKPFAASIEGAKELIDLKNTHNLKVLVAENFRYTEESKIIKNLISSDEIGEVKFFIENKITDFKEDMTKDTFASIKWRQEPVFKGGIFLDGSIHDIGKYRYLFGEITDLTTKGLPGNASFCKYEVINTILQFENNILGFYGYWNMGQEYYTPKIGLRIFGTKGEIYLEDKYCEKIILKKSGGVNEKINFIKERGFYNELNNFYNNYFGKEEIISTPEKEIGDMEVIFKILNTIETE